MERTVRWLLILACMGLVLWARTLPLSLRAVDDQAGQLMRRWVHAQLMQEAAQKSLPVPGNRQVKEWIEGNREKFAEQKAAVAERLKSRLRYTGPDGREYVNLGGVDSYLWLRHARNYLRTATVCDAIVNGECRDTYGIAPVGSQMPYSRSLHTAAIVGLHRVITYFKPDYPLPASAFLLAVILGTLGVLPAFAIGRGLAGNAGGVCAALVISLQPTFLFRSVNGDNDIWNVVLPLFMTWAALTAVAASGWRRQVLFAVLAAACVGLQAGVWKGWFFAYTILLLGLLGRIVLLSLHYGVRAKSFRVWRGRRVQEAFLLGAVFYVAAGIFTKLASPSVPYFSIPYNVLEPAVEQFFIQTSVAGDGSSSVWPNSLTTVNELLKPTLQSTLEDTGGPLLFCLGLLGLLLVMLPRTHWQWYHRILLVTGIILNSYIFTSRSPDRGTVMGLIVLSLLCCISLRLLDEKEPDDLDLGPGVIVAVWFLSGLYIAYEGLRFLPLAGLAFGMAFAVAVGRLYEVLKLFIQPRLPTSYRWSVHAFLSVLVAAVLFLPLREGYDVVRNYLPTMSRGWWDTLTKIRDESAPDTIISTWWDYGHWTKYVAERRVNADGSSLLTHVPHWLGLVLASPSEKESVGVLRMLDCGSDASPAPERRQGAYDKVLAKVKDGTLAHTIVLALVNRDAAQAREYLAQRDFTVLEQDNVLRSTHCVPPEAYLVVSSEQTIKTGVWMQLGLWDFRRSYIAQQVRSVPEEQAIPDLVARFAYSQEEATRLYRWAQTLDSRSEINDFIAPPFAYLSPQWISCQTEEDEASLACPIGLRTGPTGTILEKFVYRPTVPLESKVYLRRLRGVHNPDSPSEGTPGLLIVAGVEEKEEISFPSPQFPRIGVLLDLPKKRILIGPPPLIRSTFTHQSTSN
ncbi:MAG: hypothetical protein HY268_19395 [Deltaproteobacteria bacterium]|nr:hypothetical protein [Deltaproteobacteria bacterium]